MESCPICGTGMIRSGSLLRHCETDECQYSGKLMLEREWTDTYIFHFLRDISEKFDKLLDIHKE